MTNKELLLRKQEALRSKAARVDEIRKKSGRVKEVAKTPKPRSR